MATRIPSPYTLGLYFHTIEVWGDGTFSVTVAESGATAGPVVSKLKRETADPLDLEVLDWIIYMISHRRILWVHLAPPSPKTRCQDIRIKSAVSIFIRLTTRYNISCSCVLPDSGSDFRVKVLSKSSLFLLSFASNFA